MKFQDNVGNWGTMYTDDIIYDNVDPVTTIVSPAASSWHNSDFSVNFDDTDTNLDASSCRYRIEENGAQSYPAMGWASRTCGGDVAVDISSYCAVE